MRIDKELNEIYQLFDTIMNKLKRVQYSPKIFEDDIELEKIVDEIIEKCRRYDNKHKSSGSLALLLFYMYIYALSWKLNFIMHQCGIYDYRGRYIAKGQDSLVQSKTTEAIKCCNRLLELYERSQKLKCNDEHIRTLFASSKREIYEIYSITKTKLGTIYLSKLEYDLAIENFSEVDNIQSLSMLLYINLYVDDYFDYNAAIDHYNQLMKMPITDFNNAERLRLEKVGATRYLFQYLYKIGDYEKARDILNTNEFIKVLSELNDSSLNKTRELNIAECQNKINEQTTVVTDNYCLEVGIKSKNIEKMSTEIKALISTSVSMFNYIKQVEAKDTMKFMDYSSVSISALKACEAIFYELLGKKYLNYINQKSCCGEKIDFNQLPNAFKFRKKSEWILSKYVPNLELGSVVCCGMEKTKEFNCVRPYFKEFCDFYNLGLSEEEILNHFEKLDNIRYLRNIAAHKTRMLSSDADECKDILFDTYAFIDKTYDMFGSLLENKQEIEADVEMAG